MATATQIIDTHPPAEPSDDDMVLLTDLHKSYGSLSILKGVDLKVRRSSVTCLIGPSGSGKTTLLRCVNCLEIPDSGWIWVNGQPVNRVRTDTAWRPARESELRRHRVDTGMVFQQYNLFPHKSVLENITFAPRHVRGIEREEATATAMELLSRVGLADKADKYPGQLSGGQQQRVAIARSLAMSPKVMLFDEITSALDPETVGEVLTVVRELATSGMTMILVTHEMDFARDVADHVVFMDGGVVVEEGLPAQVIDDPQVERTRTFMRRINQR